MTAKIVKSVARVLEILELFSEVQKPLPAVEIAERLGYPLASTHEILKTMVELGFFSYGEPKWAYKPSSRFPDAVDWVKGSLTRDSKISMLMEALNNETLETINLSQKISTQVKIMKGLECRYQIGVSSKPGTHMDVSLSLTGIVALSHLNQDGQAAFFKSLKLTHPDVFRATNFNLIKSIHEELEQYGCSMRVDINMSGIGAVCCPIISTDNEHYVLGIVGPSHRILDNSAQLIWALKTHVQQCSVRTLYKIKLR